MRIVIDLQGAQAENGHRGIGRYCLSLSQAIVRNRGDHEVYLVLNGEFPESVNTIRSVFNALLPNENIRVWYPLKPSCEAYFKESWFSKTSESTREAFLASLNPSVILVSSLFEGMVDNATTSIGSLTSCVPTAVILYDLIPFVYRDLYLQNSEVEKWYERKLNHLRRADLLLTISESTRQECVDYLGFPTDSIISISAAIDKKFRVEKIDELEKATLFQQYGLDREYVMYTGGVDHRKNIEGLIRAYATLSESLIEKYQLAIVCAMPKPEQERLELFANELGLIKGNIVFTGYVDERSLIALYNLCKAFVFPSWHEGFGLPALEAMACGKAVIASNISSLPEVIGCSDALFNPFDTSSIRDKLGQVLEDEDFRLALEKHSLVQAKKFSWDESAKLAIGELEKLHLRHIGDLSKRSRMSLRPRLAYVSPIPPDSSGIANYSVELLPELSRYYEIDIVVEQKSASSPAMIANYQVQTCNWFRDNSEKYDRIIYHFGNSHYHRYMLELIQDIPGLVVLHDFYLSGLVSHMELASIVPGYWQRELYRSHGYQAIYDFVNNSELREIEDNYPCNLGVLQAAEGVIVHSQFSSNLANKWYGDSAGEDWACIPLLRTPAIVGVDRRKSARTALGMTEDNFVVCSFGLLGPSKLNHRLLSAWLSSPLAKDERCKLIFVGQNFDGSYGDDLRNSIIASGLSDRIIITGWVDGEAFNQYLRSADLSVQLRTSSRGETSAAVLDCMNYGLATIVNANGSMAELPGDGVFQLPDVFTDEQLSEALTVLWKDEFARQALGARAREIIHDHHSPRSCAELYFSAIEEFHQRYLTSQQRLIKKIGYASPDQIDIDVLLKLAENIDSTFKPHLYQKQLLVDISELVQRDSRTGIQRVVRSIIKEWLSRSVEGYRVEPVYADADGHGYRYARNFSLNFVGSEYEGLDDDPISYHAGDIFLGLDLQHHVVISHSDFYRKLMRHGVDVRFVVYDLLPILHSEYFIGNGADLHREWLSIVAQSSGAICISKSVADELLTWIASNVPDAISGFDVSWFHLGADVDGSVPSKGLPCDAPQILQAFHSRPSFLMVGTVEPRKGHAQVLAGFERMWEAGENVNLVIVGKQGWMVDRLIEEIRHHQELNRRLFWLENISDEYLEKVYSSCVCLIAASYGEGFGLPLIEAAQNHLPIIARDIPVFREVAGDAAYYFGGHDPESVASALVKWLELLERNEYPTTKGMKWLTWEESAEQLKRCVLGTSQAKQETSEHFTA